MLAGRGDRKPEGERQQEVPKEKETGRGRERKKTAKAVESIKNTGGGENQRQLELKAQLGSEVLAVGRQTSRSDAVSIRRGICSPALILIRLPSPFSSRTYASLGGGSLNPPGDGAKQLQALQLHAVGPGWHHTAHRSLSLPAPSPCSEAAVTRVGQAVGHVKEMSFLTQKDQQHGCIKPAHFEWQ